MSTLQETPFNADIAAAVGDVVRARGSANAGTHTSFNSSFDANLAARITPIVLTSLRSFAQQQSGQPGFAHNPGQPQHTGQQHHQGQPAQSGYQTQAGQPSQQGYQTQQGYLPQQGYQTQQGLQHQQQAVGQHTNGSQASQLSSRGTLAAVVTPIVAQALTRYQPVQNAANGYNGPRPLDHDWLDSITSVVAEVTPAVIDALKTFGSQPGAQNNVNATNLAAAAQRGSFDDLTSVVASTVPVVINALRDYQPQRAQAAQQRNGSDDAFDVARVAAPIAIAAL